MEYGLLCKSGFAQLSTKLQGEKGGNILIENESLIYEMKSETGTDYNFHKIACEYCKYEEQITKLVLRNTVGDKTYQQVSTIDEEMGNLLKIISNEKYKNNRCVFVVKEGRPQKKTSSIFEDYITILDKLSDWTKIN